MPPIVQHWIDAILSAIPNIFAAIVIFVGSIYLARLAANLLTRALKQRHMVSNVVNLISQLVYLTIIVVGVIASLSRFFDVTAYIAGLGLAGFAIGFALQDVLKNLAAGVILLMQQPFRVGEAISVAGFDGTVLTVDLRATEMSTFDGRRVSIPNATILNSPITNFTRAARRRVDIPLKLPPGTDVESTRRIVLDAVRRVPGAMSEPEPTVQLQQIAGDAINLTGSFWVDVSKTNPDIARDLALTYINEGLAQGKTDARTVNA
ncbi:MAG TPA: mechanosensitive ion channel [Anaerolineales bacterium]|nr:mechanosensitive ion channel [Anaerolineales bacterium]